MSFISDLAADLIQRPDLYDFSRISEFSFFGLRETRATIDFVGIVQADELNERQIVELRNQYLEAVQQASCDFGIRPYARNPNGLLLFVFENHAPGKISDFIRKQTRAEIFNRPAVVFSWSIDVQAKQVRTHNNLVNLVPPIYILESMVFPGKDYLSKVLTAYSPLSPDGPQVVPDPPEVAWASQSQSSNIDSNTLTQIERLFQKLTDEVIRNMPAPKYNLPNVTKLQVFEQVDQYVENQTVSDPQVEVALADLKGIIQTLQGSNPQANERQAAEILDVEFQEIQRSQPKRWNQLRNLKRWWNGVRTGSIRAGEHFAESTVWGKIAIGFLEGLSEETEP